ncbi:hypothetical protein Efla_007048 [Eimeria flavescens]
MQPEDGGISGVSSEDLKQGKKKTGMHLKPFGNNGGRQRPVVLFALLVVNSAIAFSVFCCYLARELPQQRRLAEGPQDAAAANSKHEERRSKAKEKNRLPTPSGSAGEMDDLSSMLQGGMRLSPEVSPVANVVAVSAVEGLPLDVSIYERQLSLLRLPGQLKANLRPGEKQLIDRVAELLKDYLTSRKTRSVNWQKAVEKQIGAGAADSKRGGSSKRPHSKFETEARVDLLKIKLDLKDFKSSSAQVSRPLLLTARFRLQGRHVSSRAIEALAVAETLSGVYLSPDGVETKQEVDLIDQMALEMLEKAASAEEKLAECLRHMPADPDACTGEMQDNLEKALKEAEKLRKEVSIFSRQLRLLYRIPLTPNRLRMKQLSKSSASHTETDGL